MKMTICDVAVNMLRTENFTHSLS